MKPHLTSSEFERLKLRTYSHLDGHQRLPSEYEIATSNLHYYVSRGFEIEVPISSWYRQHQTNSPLQCENWERFADPRETTYTKYTTEQRKKEAFIDGLIQSLENTDYDKKLSPAWLSALSAWFAPLRYPFHGFQMIAAYIGQMAPASRITITAMFQSADEIRRVQRCAYRMAELQKNDSEFGTRSKEVWEKEPAWQPLREAIETLLITYDWGEAFIALNLCLKPIIDDLFLTHFAALARQRGDYLLCEILCSLGTDSKWQQAWSTALLKVALEDRPQNKEVIQAWVNKWFPVAARAAWAFEPIFESSFASVKQEIATQYNALLSEIDLESPSFDGEGLAS